MILYDYCIGDHALAKLSSIRILGVFLITQRLTFGTYWWGIWYYYFSKFQIHKAIRVVVHLPSEKSLEIFLHEYLFTINISIQKWFPKLLRFRTTRLYNFYENYRIFLIQNPLMYIIYQQQVCLVLIETKINILLHNSSLELIIIFVLRQ